MDWFSVRKILQETIDFPIFFYGAFCLVGGIPTPLTNMKVSWDSYSQPYGSKYLLRKYLGYDLED